MKKILILPGDGIGPEIVAEAVKVLETLRREFGLAVETEQGLIGGAACDATERRPERGLLAIRSALSLFANLRPAILYPPLADASTLRPEVVAGLDIMIVRELTGGIYFGEPRGIRTLENGERQGYNTLVYSESEIRRIGRVAFETAMRRGRRVTSVDKAVRGQRRHAAGPGAPAVRRAGLLRYSLGEAELAGRVEQAVERVIAQGLRTADIHSEGCRRVGTAEMGDAVVAALMEQER